MDRAAGLSTSQKGKIAELFVASALMAGSGGRLSPFVPLVDDHGVDLVVVDKETGGSVAVQVKAWMAGAGSGRRTAQFDVRKATFGGGEGSVVVAVILDPSSMAMEAAWLIPMSDVPEVAVDQPSKFALSPSRSATSRDAYSGYRHPDAVSLAEALSAMIRDRKK